MIRNFAKFARYPWAAQCLEMARRTGCQYCDYGRNIFGDLIKRGNFKDALRSARSVGSWIDSVQGDQYWRDICQSEFGDF